MKKLEEFTPSEITQIATNFSRLAYMLNSAKKAFTIKETFKHISGKVIESTATIPVTFNLREFTANSPYFLSAALLPPDGDLEKDWIKLREGSSNRFISCSLEQYMAAPVWDDSMLSITSKII